MSLEEAAGDPSVCIPAPNLTQCLLCMTSMQPRPLRFRANMLRLARPVLIATLSQNPPPRRLARAPPFAGLALLGADAPAQAAGSVLPGPLVVCGGVRFPSGVVIRKHLVGLSRMLPEGYRYSGPQA